MLVQYSRNLWTRTSLGYRCSRHLATTSVCRREKRKCILKSTYCSASEKQKQNKKQLNKSNTHTQINYCTVCSSPHTPKTYPQLIRARLERKTVNFHPLCPSPPCIPPFIPMPPRLTVTLAWMKPWIAIILRKNPNLWTAMFDSTRQGCTTTSKLVN